MANLLKKIVIFQAFSAGGAKERKEGRPAGEEEGASAGAAAWLGWRAFFLSDIGLAACQRLDDHMDL